MKDATDVFAEIPALIGVSFGEGQDIDGIFSSVAERLRARGMNVAGLIQIRGEPDEDCACRDMYLRDLASGELHRISEERGPEAKGCHLDWEALTTLAQATTAKLSAETSLLFINRFGRSESEGRGMRSVIEKAMMLGVPVVVACRDQYAAGWETFHGGLALDCPADENALVELVEKRVKTPTG